MHPMCGQNRGTATSSGVCDFDGHESTQARIFPSQVVDDRRHFSTRYEPHPTIGQTNNESSLNPFSLIHASALLVLFDHLARIDERHVVFWFVFRSSNKYGESVAIMGLGNKIGQFQ
mmetsp:Transcript_22673/g.52366  ORF Transcript_22673/g.52366 Transcript_22673/m.52366 type:complete len:117 (+) Transcript_22673:1986-2336(+)